MKDKLFDWISRIDETKVEHVIIGGLVLMGAGFLVVLFWLVVLFLLGLPVMMLFLALKECWVLGGTARIVMLIITAASLLMGIGAVTIRK